MYLKVDSLVDNGGLLEGDTSISFHTLGMVGKDDNQQRPILFNDFNFFGPRYQSSPKELKNSSEAYDSIQRAFWSDAWQVDAKDHELVVNSVSTMGKRWSERVKLFEFNMSYSLKEVDLNKEEYLEVKRWNAIQRLNPEEITLLGLDKIAVYLKLKYSDGSKKSNSGHGAW